MFESNISLVKNIIKNSLGVLPPTLRQTARLNLTANWCYIHTRQCVWGARGFKWKMFETHQAKSMYN